MVIFCSLPVPLSLACTFTMPLASMSNVTSICGTPRGAGGMPSRWNLPSVRLSRAMLPLALHHVHFDARLAVGRRREHLALARRNRRVARNQRRHHAAERFDAERQRRHVEQQQVLHVAREHAGLDRRADRDDFVRVDALVRLLAEQLLDDLLHARNARRAADEHHLVDGRWRHAGVLQRLLRRPDGLLQQVLDERLELRPRQLHRQMLRARWHPP